MGIVVKKRAIVKKNNQTKQKMYRYNKPAEEGKKAPLILCYANNEVHAMQLFRDRFEGEKINKEWIVEYIPPEDNKKKDKKNNK